MISDERIDELMQEYIGSVQYAPDRPIKDWRDTPETEESADEYD